MTRIGTFAQQQLTLFRSLNTQARIFESQTQVASGKRSQEFSGIARDVNRLVTIRGELNRVDQFKQNIITVDKRLQLMEFTLNQVETVARDFRTTLNASLNGDTADLLNLPAEAAGLRDQIVDLLNTRDDTRYLFAGGKVDTRPVQLGNGTYVPPSPPPPRHSHRQPTLPTTKAMPSRSRFVSMMVLSSTTVSPLIRQRLRK